LSKVLQMLERLIDKFSIPRGQLVRATAAKLGMPAEVVVLYLGGAAALDTSRAHWIVGSTMEELLWEIAWARYIEERQLDSGRRGPNYLAPRMPGVPGREKSLFRLRRGEFIELVRLSQPELVREAEALAERKRRARWGRAGVRKKRPRHVGNAAT